MAENSERSRRPHDGEDHSAERQERIEDMLSRAKRAHARPLKKDGHAVDADATENVKSGDEKR
jgi:hypothetical protein